MSPDFDGYRTLKMEEFHESDPARPAKGFMDDDLVIGGP
jgi:hypothetical protein